jgi:hypothetical protein
MIFGNKGYSHPNFFYSLFIGNLIPYINISADYVFTLY